MTNNSLTILAPSPINFWTSSEPETLIKVHSVWCATARARSVFPVPGGPYSNTPWKNLMISTSILKKLHLHRTVLSIFKMFLFKSISLYEICVDVLLCFNDIHMYIKKATFTPYSIIYLQDVSFLINFPIWNLCWCLSFCFLSLYSW